MNVRVIGLALLLLRGAAACADEAPPTDNERVTALDLVVMDEERLARLNLSIDLAGRPLAALWSDDHLFAPLVELCDRNDDGALDEAVSRIASGRRIGFNHAANSDAEISLPRKLNLAARPSNVP